MLWAVSSRTFSKRRQLVVVGTARQCCSFQNMAAIFILSLLRISNKTHSPHQTVFLDEDHRKSTNLSESFLILKIQITWRMAPRMLCMITERQGHRVTRCKAHENHAHSISLNYRAAVLQFWRCSANVNQSIFSHREGLCAIYWQAKCF